MSEVPFGFGVLSQGESILSPEQDRLVAKRAWMQLWEYLSRNDEYLKAARIPIPHTLEKDYDVRRAMSESWQVMKRFDSEENYLKFIDQQESLPEEEIQRNIDRARNVPRYEWMYRNIMAENPLTVLEVGPAYGEFTLLMARSGIHVTSLVPLLSKISLANRLVKEEILPVEWIEGILENYDFKDTKFDIVVACEVIEHVANDLQFVQKCADLAKNMILITTPAGSMEQGFLPYAETFHDFRKRAHVRAYTEASLMEMLGEIKGIGKDFKILTINSMGGYRDQGLPVFAVKLRKEPKNVGQEVDSSRASYLPPGAKVFS